MSIFEIFLTGVGLSMDAFAVSICKGLTLRQRSIKYALITGAWFGIFQGLMPMIGFFVGSRFASYVEDVDHWIVFVLLALIGGHMILEAKKEEEPDPSFGFKAMFLLAVATSIDALAVGVSFAFLKVEIFMAAGIIAATTFVISILGIETGTAFGTRFKSKAEIAGGLILILIGTKTLIQGLMGA